jgi:hypothetical protein
MKPCLAFIRGMPPPLSKKATAQPNQVLILNMKIIAIPSNQQNPGN